MDMDRSVLKVPFESVSQIFRKSQKNISRTLATAASEAIAIQAALDQTSTPATMTEGSADMDKSADVHKDEPPQNDLRATSWVLGAESAHGRLIALESSLIRARAEIVAADCKECIRLHQIGTRLEYLRQKKTEIAREKESPPCDRKDLAEAMKEDAEPEKKGAEKTGELDLIDEHLRDCNSEFSHAEAFAAVRERDRRISTSLLVPLPPKSNLSPQSTSACNDKTHYNSTSSSSPSSSSQARERYGYRESGNGGKGPGSGSTSRNEPLEKRRKHKATVGRCVRALRRMENIDLSHALASYLVQEGLVDAAQTLCEEEEEKKEQAEGFVKRPPKQRSQDSETAAATPNLLPRSRPPSTSLADFIDLDVHRRIHKVMNSLLGGRATSDFTVHEALAWCADHASRLRRIDSPLEFALRKREFLELVREDRKSEAVAYATEHLSEALSSIHHQEQEQGKNSRPDKEAVSSTGEEACTKQRSIQDNRSKEVQEAMATLAICDGTLPPLNTPRLAFPAHLMHFADLFCREAWTDLGMLFLSEAKLVYGLPKRCHLDLLLEFGLSVLKSRACVDILGANMGTDSRGAGANGDDGDAKGSEQQVEYRGAGPSSSESNSNLRRRRTFRYSSRSNSMLAEGWGRLTFLQRHYRNSTASSQRSIDSSVGTSETQSSAMEEGQQHSDSCAIESGEGDMEPIRRAEVDNRLRDHHRHRSHQYDLGGTSCPCCSNVSCSILSQSVPFSHRTQTRLLCRISGEIMNDIGLENESLNLAEVRSLPRAVVRETRDTLNSDETYNDFREEALEDVERDGLLGSSNDSDKSKGRRPMVLPNGQVYSLAGLRQKAREGLLKRSMPLSPVGHSSPSATAPLLRTRTRSWSDPSHSMSPRSPATTRAINCSRVCSPSAHGIHGDRPLRAVNTHQYSRIQSSEELLVTCPETGDSFRLDAAKELFII